MAHKMVRQPSETPNINNIDDIVPFRYAYGNQNGYVINKGNELSYIVNGSEFKINSGRVVLQGVEDDIDANGVSFTIDNIASTRYYVVYYRVNLATNTTSYEVTYDTAGYPTIDIGDDLTKNSSGIANLPLYRFTASSGIIGSVEKVVQPIEYINKNSTIENSKKINNLEIVKDNNGALRIGDIIIPQRKKIFDNLAGNQLTSFTLSEGLVENDIIEIEYQILSTTNMYEKFKFVKPLTSNYMSYEWVYIKPILVDDVGGNAIYEYHIHSSDLVNFTCMGKKRYTTGNPSGDVPVIITAIYKIIE